MRKQMTIETKKAASVKEATEILQSLLPNGKFEYDGENYGEDYANEHKETYRFFDGTSERGATCFAMIEIIDNKSGELVKVRFLNTYRDTAVDIYIESASKLEVEEYAVSTEAQEVAVEAEIELAAKTAASNEPEVDEYLVSADAQETAIDAEIELATATAKKAAELSKPETQEKVTVNKKISVAVSKAIVVEIEMYGNKSPMFSVLVNGKSYGFGRNLKRKDVDKLIRDIYSNPTARANTIIEIPEVVASLDFVKVFNDKPKLLRELNVVFTGIKDDGGERQIGEYARAYGVSPETIDLAAELETELALAAGTAAKNSEPDSSDDEPCEEILKDISSAEFVQINGNKWINSSPTLIGVANQISFIVINQCVSRFDKTQCRYAVVLKGTDERGYYQSKTLKYFEKKAAAQDFCTQIIPLKVVGDEQSEMPADQISSADSKVDLPNGEHIVASGLAAFTLVAPYFPNGLEFDGIDYGYRGETQFCFYNETCNMSVIAASDETNHRIETLQIVNHNAPGNDYEKSHPLTVLIQQGKIVDEPEQKVETSRAKSTDKKKGSCEKKSPAAKKVLAEKTPVEKKAIAKKKTSADKTERWLQNAKLDESGRYYIVPELVYSNIESHSNWKPCFYIVTNELKLRRVGLKFAVELAKLEQATEISKEKFATLEK